MAAPVTLKRFRKWEPAKRRQFLQRNTFRSAAEFRALTPKQKKATLARGTARRDTRIAAANDPATLYKPLTPREVDTQANINSRLKYGDALRQIAKDRGVSDLQAGRVEDYFKQYEGMQKQANAATHNAFARAVNDIATTAAANQQHDEAAAQQAAAEATADAQARGAVVDPAVQGEADAAAASRKNALDVINAVVQGQGANNDTLGNRMLGVTRNQGFQSVAKERAFGRSLDTKKRDMLTDKGLFRASERDRLRSQEYKNYMERKAFGLQQSKLQADIATDAATLAVRDKASQRTAAGKRRANRIASKKANETVRHNVQTEKTAQQRADQAGQTQRQKASGALTPSQQTKFVGQVKTASSYINRLMNNPKANTAKVRVALQTGLVDGNKYTADQVTLAFQLWRGGIDRSGLQLFQDNGVKLKGRLPRLKGPQINVTNRRGQLPNP